MSLTSLVAAAAIAAVVSAPSSYAQNAAPRSANVTVNAREMDVRDYARQVTTQTGVRVLVGTGAAGKVTLSLEAVPLETAVRIAAETAKLRWARLDLAPSAAAALTAETAVPLIGAADVLMKAKATVTLGPTAIGPTSAPAAGLVPVYIIDAGPEAEKARAAKETEAARQRDDLRAADLSPSARKDPAIVRSWSALKDLQPEQVATVAVEFMRTMTPETRERVDAAMRDMMRQQSRPQE